MSGDKDIEGQPFPSDPIDEQSMDEPAGFPEDDLAAADFPGEDPGGEEDFIEEDWEAYDDEAEFIDDSEGDGVAERKAAFNKMLLGGAALLIIGGGAFFVLGSKQEENMGAPVMEQVSQPADVSPNQKVEFHAETKVQPKDAFGVTYGKQAGPVTEEVEIKDSREGILNNPEALARLRNRDELVPTTYVVEEDGGQYQGGVQQVEGQPPMPAPIGQAETGAQDLPGSERFDMNDNPRIDTARPEEGLIPMPERLRGPEEGPSSGASANLPNAAASSPNAAAAQQGALDVSAAEEEVVPSFRTASERSSAPATSRTEPVSEEALGDLNGKLDRISSRLEEIEDGLAVLDNMQDDLAKLESRLVKIEKAPPRTTASQPAPSRPASSRKESSVKASSAPQASSWVLKSAQPGEAMVARKGDSEMYTVTVGETFANIGRITGISIENGRWVVRGTNGRITQ